MGTLAIRIGHAGRFDTLYNVTLASVASAHAWAAFMCASFPDELVRHELHIEGLDILGHRVSMKFAGFEVRSLRLFVPRIQGMEEGKSDGGVIRRPARSGANQTTLGDQHETQDVDDDNGGADGKCGTGTGQSILQDEQVDRP